MVKQELLFDKKYLIGGIVFFGIYLFVFVPILNTSFFPQSDDVWYILDNPQLKNFNFIEVFTKSYQGQYSPLNTLFLYWIKQSFGLSAFYFHLYSLALHTINGVLVFFIVKKLIRSDNDKLFIPFFTSVLFLIHPLQIEAVAWISASKWVSVTTFMLLSILFYLQFRLHSFTICILYSIICFILAILCKEIGVVLPMLLFIIEAFFLKTKFSSLKRLLPYFIASLTFGIFTFYIPIFQPGLQAVKMNSVSSFANDSYLSIRCTGDYLFYLFIPLYRREVLPLLTGQVNVLPSILSALLVSISVLLYFFTNEKTLIGCFLFFLCCIFLHYLLFLISVQYC